MNEKSGHFILKKGTIIHIKGIPFGISEDCVIEGNAGNIPIAGLHTIGIETFNGIKMVALKGGS